MPLWLRAVEFAVWWTVLAGAVYGAAAVAASRSSPSAGWAARAAGSLGVGALGVFVGFHDVLTLGVLAGGDYRYLLPAAWWWPWAFGAVAAALPWAVWASGWRRTRAEPGAAADRRPSSCSVG